jgi:hypothetical protein
VDQYDNRGLFHAERGSVYFDRELQSVKAKYRALEGPEQKKKYVEDRKELVKALGEVYISKCSALTWI